MIETIKPETREVNQRMFYIKLFGELEITDGSRTLREDDLRSRQMLKLFACLLLSSQKSMTDSEMVDILWGAQANNPSHALKNLTYRLRRALAEVWPDVEFIITSAGQYYLNPQLTIQMDIFEFRTLLGSWEKAQEGEKSLEILMKAYSLYEGKVLKNLNNFKWINYIQVWYTRHYADVVKQLCKWLCSRGEFYQAEKFALNAIRREPQEEQIHICYLQVCLQEKKKEEAVSAFHSIIHLFYDDGADPLSEDLERIRQRYLADEKLRYENLAEIMKKIKERNPQGAMRVSRQTMVDLIRMFYRMEADRECQLVLFTLNKKTEDEEENILPADVIERFEKILCENLQRTDVLTSYSKGKYLVLFTACNRQSTEKSLKQIRKVFAEQDCGQGSQIHIQIRRLVPVDSCSAGSCPITNSFEII